MVSMPDIFINKSDCTSKTLVQEMITSSESLFCNDPAGYAKLRTKFFFFKSGSFIENDSIVADRFLKQVPENIKKEIRPLFFSGIYSYPSFVFLNSNEKKEFRYKALQSLFGKGEYLVTLSYPDYLTKSKRYKNWIYELNEADSAQSGYSFVETDSTNFTNNSFLIN